MYDLLKLFFNRLRVIRKECERKWPPGSDLPTFDSDENSSILDEFVKVLLTKPHLSEMDSTILRKKIITHMQSRRKKRKLDLVNPTF